MQQAYDEAGNVWEVDAQGNPVRLLRPAQQQQAQQPRQQVPQVVREAPPPPPQQAPVRTPAGAATEGLKPGYAYNDPNNPAAGQYKIPTSISTNTPQATERRAQIKTILGNIQRIRGLADENLAVGSWAQFMQGVPGLNQNALNVQAGLKQIQGDLIQQKVALLAEANQGGVASLANSASEAERMAASIAALGETQSLPEFMKGLEDAENYYLLQAGLLTGKDAPDNETRAAFLPQERLKELQAANAQSQQTALSPDGQAVPIPSWYRESVARYLAENKGELDPSQYAAFRRNLDQEAGFPGDIAQYVNDGQQFREFMAKGGKPEQIQIMQSFSRPTSEGERAMTEFAETPFGAGTVSAFNSAAAGLPGRLSGNQEAVEAVRQNQPVASFIGDMAGGVAGSLGVGGAAVRLGARGLAANPMAQNAVFGGVSGATQSEDPLTGAAIGAIGSIGGDMLGRQIGRALPNVFASGSMRTARESVPSEGDLANEAANLYRRAGANGEMIQPQQVDDFIGESDAFLRSNGFIDQQGNILGTGPVQDATRLLQSFRGQPIGPAEAQTIRNKIAEGRMAMREGAPDNQARMFSGQMTDRFDQFAEAQNALPGIADARQVAQRRIISRELSKARELGTARGEINYSQGGDDLGIRRAYGALDTAEIRGSKMYPDEVMDAIQKVSRGTPVRNLAQNLGKLSPQGGGGQSVGLLSGLGVGSAAGDVATGGMVTGGLYGAGLLGRSAAGKLTRQDAEMAELVARGGPAFQQMLRDAEEEAAIRGGRVGGGLLGTAAIMPFRDY